MMPHKFPGSIAPSAIPEFISSERISRRIFTSRKQLFAKGGIGPKQKLWLCASTAFSRPLLPYWVGLNYFRFVPITEGHADCGDRILLGQFCR
jgi:hypothetical protein